MKIDGKELSEEVMAKALQCDTPEELVKVAKDEGIEITVKQAEVWFTEMEDINLSSAQMKQVAGGKAWNMCPWDKE